MKIIIISGAYGWKQNPDKPPVLILKGMTCDVPEEEARRLSTLKVAQICADEEPLPTDAMSPEVPSEKTAQGEQSTSLNSDMLNPLTVAQLHDLAEKMGLNMSKRATKAQLISAIAAEEVEPGEEETFPGFDLEGQIV